MSTRRFIELPNSEWLAVDQIVSVLGLPDEVRLHDGSSSSEATEPFLCPAPGCGYVVARAVVDWIAHNDEGILDLPALVGAVTEIVAAAPEPDEAGRPEFVATTFVEALDREVAAAVEAAAVFAAEVAAEEIRVGGVPTPSSETGEVTP